MGRDRVAPEASGPARVSPNPDRPSGRSIARGLLANTLVLAALTVLLSPFFFVVYRLAVFNTVPHDDYAPYLLWLVGHPGGFLPGSPYGYRLFSVVAAWPFYELLPALRLTNIPADIAPDVLKATAALSAMSLVAAIVASMLAYHTAIRHAGLSRAEGVLAGALLFALSWYTQVTAIDSLAIMLIALAVLLSDRRLSFAFVLIVSALTNEKVPLVIAAWLTLRCVLHARDRRRFGWQWAASIAALAVYGIAVLVLRLPGNAYQTTLASIPDTIRGNLAAYLDPRGLALNVLPIAVLAAIAVAAYARPAKAARGGLFRASDMLVIPAMMAVALIWTLQFQAGRIVMHAAPLFVVPATAAARAWLRGLPSGETL
jgi:hypothetical protein